MFPPAMFWVFLVVLVIAVVFCKPIQTALVKRFGESKVRTVEDAVQEVVNHVVDFAKKEIQNGVSEIKNHISMSNKNQALAVLSAVKNHVDEALRANDPAMVPAGAQEVPRANDPVMVPADPPADPKAEVSTPAEVPLAQPRAVELAQEKESQVNSVNSGTGSIPVASMWSNGLPSKDMMFLLQVAAVFVGANNLAYKVLHGTEAEILRVMNYLHTTGQDGLVDVTVHDHMTGFSGPLKDAVKPYAQAAVNMHKDPRAKAIYQGYYDKYLA